MSKHGLHFFGVDPELQALPLAAALGVGERTHVGSADARRFERLQAEAPSRWDVVDETSADLFLYAHPYLDHEACRAGVTRAQELGKPCLLFHTADETASTDPPWGTVYRDSMLLSERRPHEHAMPAFSDDLAREVGGFQPLVKREKPSVGFCGYVGAAWRRALFRLQGRQRKVLGLTLRAQALAALERSPRVATNFVRRTQFWGGAISRFRGPDPDAKRRVREEYLENLSGSDYTLCMRGAGNFSFRFYETLAMGRIPLFVNTDCLMPFDDTIDWRRHVVWIEQHELGRIGELLADFHDRLSDDDYQQLQHDNRRLWEEHLRPTEAYQHVIDRALQQSAPTTSQ